MGYSVMFFNVLNGTKSQLKHFIAVNRRSSPVPSLWREGGCLDRAPPLRGRGKGAGPTACHRGPARPRNLCSGQIPGCDWPSSPGTGAPPAPRGPGAPP